MSAAFLSALTLRQWLGKKGVHLNYDQAGWSRLSISSHRASVLNDCGLSGRDCRRKPIRFVRYHAYRCRCRDRYPVLLRDVCVSRLRRAAPFDRYEVTPSEINARLSTMSEHSPLGWKAYRGSSTSRLWRVEWHERLSCERERWSGQKRLLKIPTIPRHS